MEQVMPAHLTPSEARALGIPAPRGRAPKDRSTAKGPYLTVCKSCGEQFTTMAAEDRHLHETHHIRYQILIDKA
jgi:hypothetical protein